jgi:hypothetical protein
MPDHRIKREFARHSSGTKAYQVWSIQCGGAAVTVFQYASYSGGRSPEHMGGTIDVIGVSSALGSEKACEKKVREKTKRGYENWTREVVEPIDFAGTLTDYFGLAKQQVILAKLATASSAVSEPAPEPDVQDVVMGKAKSIAPATEQFLPEWGTW